MKELVSIIIPVYNVEKYLERCITSVITQTYKNLEIILVDDGSPDRCGKICDEYAKIDNRIKVIHKENGGLSDARNVGIDASNGRYLMFVDSDDYISPDMVEVLYDRVCIDKSDMAICDFVYVDENYREIEEKNNNTPIKNEIISRYDALKKLTENGNWYYVAAVKKLYEKRLFDDIRFPKEKLHEDEFTVHHIFDKCNRISCVEKPMYFYVQRNFSIMNSAYSVKRLDAAEACIDRIVFFTDRAFNNLAEETALRTLGIFIQASEKLNLSEKQNKSRYFELKKQFEKIYREKLRNKVSLKLNFGLSVFFANEKLYGLLTSFLFELRKNGLKGCTRLFLRKVKNTVSKYLEKYMFCQKLRRKAKKLKKFGKTAFIMATPCHGNLGDHAIVYAEYAMLKRFGYSENIIEITNNDYKNNKEIIKRYVSENDVIIIDGGGNLGTLWPWEDDKISEIIDNYKNNRIIVFPQTCYYDDSTEAKERLNKNNKIYKEAKHLVITLRDRASYEFCRDNFPDVEFKFLPDIVLSLKKDSLKNQEDKCLVCFREDLESVLTAEEIDCIYSKLKDMGIAYEKISTIYGIAVSSADREKRLEEIWVKISQSRLVITDRLHAMIFAAITGTPCLALDNKSKKVSGVYEWIENLDYVKVVNSAEEMISLISKFYVFEKREYNAENIRKQFNQIESFLNQDWSEKDARNCKGKTACY